ncbi:MAG: flagellar biosynthetic protein FliO [Aromatoleum sp.]|uniref:flagellar biosynthetic protein FliO n=1 Tax=Aromatoleum sp. TaxID=2307007 RepID=UPI0028955302|nr:flagellar biosynthetic protein FliO [Aromatoleum sp.]MDT3668909.1 flagellar biosynthetic protein FliO [Aromatoleum sp.]
MTPLRFTHLALLLAASPPLAAADAPPDVAGSIGQMVFGLAVVIGLLLTGLWLIKRLSVARGAMTGLKVLGAAPVGPRERVVLVEIAGKVLVLGVTSASVNTLHTLSADEAAGLVGSDPGKAAGDFPGWLKRAMERRNDAR